jgi:predicted lipid-binding transport protein (Tim44 family)
MLIAPFSVSPAERSRSASPTPLRPARAKAPIGGLLAWLAVGIGVLLLVPFARGDHFFGATLPFWLVVAPLVDLGWVERRRIARRMTETWRDLGRARPARNVRAQRTPRRAACNAASS